MTLRTHPAIPLTVNTKFCSGCRWVMANRRWSVGGKWTFAKCGEPRAIQGGTDLLHPDSEVSRIHCSVMREFSHLCGREGKLWEPKA